MKKIKRLFITAIILCLATVNSFALNKVAQSKMQFLKIGVGARAAALGDAYTAIAGEPNSIFYNPAGCAFVDGLNVEFNKTDWIADIEHLSGVISYHWGNIGTFTLNFIDINYGNMTRTVVDAHAWEGYNELGDFSVDEYAVGFGYAKNLTDRFSVGGQVKYIYQNLGETETWWYIGTEFEQYKKLNNADDVVAYDLGTYYDAGFKGLKIGMAIQNFANKSIPLTFRFGISFEINQLLFPSVKNHLLRFSWDGLHLKDYSERMHFGLEYVFRGNYFLRGGYKWNYDEENITAGAGINVNVKGVGVQFGYAFTKFGIFGSVNRFTIGLKY